MMKEKALTPRMKVIFHVFRKKVTQLREHADMSVSQLSRRSHIPAEKIAKLEAGTCQVYRRDVLRLAAALGVSVSELLRETDCFYMIGANI